MYKKAVKSLLNNNTEHNCSWDKKSQYFIGDYSFGRRAYFDVDWLEEIIVITDALGDSCLFNFKDFLVNAEILIDTLKSEVKEINLGIPNHQKYNPYSLTEEERKLYNI